MASVKIQFRLSGDLLASLEAQAQGGESLDKAAQRLLSGLLAANIQAPKTELDKMDAKFHWLSEKVSDRLIDMQNQINKLSARLTEEGLEALSKRISTLEKMIISTEQISKEPLPSPSTPLPILEYLDTKMDTMRDILKGIRIPKPLDTIADTQEDTQDDPKVDTQMDTQKDTQDDPKVDTVVDTQEDTQGDPKVDTVTDTQEDIQDDPKVDTVMDTSKGTIGDNIKGMTQFEAPYVVAKVQLNGGSRGYCEVWTGNGFNALSFGAASLKQYTQKSKAKAVKSGMAKKGYVDSRKEQIVILPLDYVLQLSEAVPEDHMTDVVLFAK